ncbi:uncharacterized protein ACA1_158880 [Acanthamoeba castellanii str. Neff]|uniref:Cysteine-rich CPCC domain-containing protein n=1 Tax=Acanthamoeba castellanii (strain ATCC 30010 / Neff) TaxID=1257118 RepID=L8HA52_ACACF|nr:uncharacterized protein ACA1_158880 [Acanthamoeba castellanii str. Neff]ELR22092.1 hypothetical protein ACA1_158880 [Acanthamoeba castellanii str. Neff]
MDEREQKQQKVACECCEYLTLPERGAWNYGANAVSLPVGRGNFARWGACEERFAGKTRPPRPNELVQLPTTSPTPRPGAPTD